MQQALPGKGQSAREHCSTTDPGGVGQGRAALTAAGLEAGPANGLVSHGISKYKTEQLKRWGELFPLARLCSAMELIPTCWPAPCCASPLAAYGPRVCQPVPREQRESLSKSWLSCSTSNICRCWAVKRAIPVPVQGDGSPLLPSKTIPSPGTPVPCAMVLPASFATPNRLSRRYVQGK